MLLTHVVFNGNNPENAKENLRRAINEYSYTNTLMGGGKVDIISQTVTHIEIGNYWTASALLRQ